MELEEGTTGIMAGQKKNCWHGNMHSPTSSFRNQNNHNKPTWKQQKEKKNVFGLKQRSTEGGGASPCPTPSSLLPVPMVVGGVGAAVDVAVGLQAVLRRSHHVGGLHRGPGEEELRAEVNERLCSHAPEVDTSAMTRFPSRQQYKVADGSVSPGSDESGGGGGHSLHEDDDVVDLDAGHGAEGAAGEEEQSRSSLQLASEPALPSAAP